MYFPVPKNNSPLNAIMKIGMNLLLRATHVTEQHYPHLEKIKATGFDGVEIPLFEGDDAHYLKLRRKGLFFREARIRGFEKPSSQRAENGAVGTRSCVIRRPAASRRASSGTIGAAHPPPQKALSICSRK